MKLGISIKLDVTKIDKARLFQGKTGAKYLDLTTFIDTDNPGQYGDHGPISQSASQEERAQGVKMPYIGNCKVFYKAESQNGTPQPQSGAPAPPRFDPAQYDTPPPVTDSQQPAPQEDGIDSIPF